MAGIGYLIHHANSVRNCMKWSILRIVTFVGDWIYRLLCYVLIILCVSLLSGVIYLAYHIVPHMIRYDMNVLDASLVFIEDGTMWAPQFTERKFDKIHQGMTQKAVRELIGEPLYINLDEPQAIYWHYAIGKDGRFMSCSRYNTHHRVVVFTASGQVACTYRSYFFD